VSASCSCSAARQGAHPAGNPAAALPSGDLAREGQLLQAARWLKAIAPGQWFALLAYSSSNAVCTTARQLQDSS
jgi:hypothetical protein